MKKPNVLNTISGYLDELSSLPARHPIPNAEEVRAAYIDLDLNLIERMLKSDSSSLRSLALYVLDETRTSDATLGASLLNIVVEEKEVLAPLLSFLTRTHAEPSSAVVSLICFAGEALNPLLRAKALGYLLILSPSQFESICKPILSGSSPQRAERIFSLDLSEVMKARKEALFGVATMLRMKAPLKDVYLLFPNEPLETFSFFKNCHPDYPVCD